MNAEYLVKMANDIAAFYASESLGPEIAKSIAAHIKRYWDPRMRKEILEHLAHGGEGMKDEVREAIAHLSKL